MESNSPIRKKVNIRSRSRSRSHSKDKHRSHHKKKKTPKVLIEENSKLEEGTKIEESSHDDKELERKFKDFEAEIHAIDPSNKSEKNETKQKKTFETTENLLLLYNKRIYVEGFPLEEFEKNEPSPKIREDFKQFFQEFKTLSILTSSQEGKQLLLIEFESRESMDSAIKLLENYEYQDSKLEIHKYLNNEDTYERKDLILPKHFKNDTELSDNQEIIPKILEPEPKHEEIAAEVYPQNFQKESQHANEYNQNDPYSPSNNSQNQQAFYPPQ